MLIIIDIIKFHLNCTTWIIVNNLSSYYNFILQNKLIHRLLCSIFLLLFYDSIKSHGLFFCTLFCIFMNQSKQINTENLWIIVEITLIQKYNYYIYYFCKISAETNIKFSKITCTINLRFIVKIIFEWLSVSRINN